MHACSWSSLGLESLRPLLPTIPSSNQCPLVQELLSDTASEVEVPATQKTGSHGKGLLASLGLGKSRHSRHSSGSDAGTSSAPLTGEQAQVGPCPSASRGGAGSRPAPALCPRMCRGIRAVAPPALHSPTTPPSFRQTAHKARMLFGGSHALSRPHPSAAAAQPSSQQGQRGHTPDSSPRRGGVPTSPPSVQRSAGSQGGELELGLPTPSTHSDEHTAEALLGTGGQPQGWVHKVAQRAQHGATRLRDSI